MPLKADPVAPKMIKVVSLEWRDGQQALLGTRVRMEDGVSRGSEKPGETAQRKARPTESINACKAEPPDHDGQEVLLCRQIERESFTTW